MPQLGDRMRSSVRVTLEGQLSPTQLGVLAGTIARKRHEQLIADGVLPSAYQRFVNGVENAPETAVRISRTEPGVILYVGSSLANAAIFAKRAAEEASPVVSGTYKASWVIAVDGFVLPSSFDLAKFPVNAREAVIANFTPYAGRMEQTYGLRGGHFTNRSRRRISGGHPRYMVSLIAAEATRSRYQGLKVRRQFVTLSGFAHSGGWEVPYHRRKPPGGTILYPAVLISAH